MREPWTAVLAAVLGLLGGLGGAAVGGYVANEGQKQRFENERVTDARNRTITAYAQFIRAAETERTNPQTTEDSVMNAAAAEVELVSVSDAVWHAAEKLKHAADNDDDGYFATALERLLRLAHEEIDGIE